MKTELVTTPQVPATTLSFDDVFSYPQYSLRGVKDWNGVSKLGSKNIAALISRARDNEQSLTGNIAKLKERQSLLKSKSGDDFKEMAKEFENPTITEIGLREGNWTRDPEPLDAASANRASGSTTFNMCGWCKQASGGSCRYSYYITTQCGLLGNTSPETRFDTPCLLQSKTADEIAEQVQRIDHEVDALLAKREKVRQGIKLLQRLKKGASEKPYLMSLRPHDHFNVGDDVIAYVGQWGNDSEHKSVVKGGVWVPAIVVFGYRHHDGCASYQALFPIHTNMSHFEGRGGGAGMSRPELLLRSEFNYLQDAAQNDVDFFLMWLDNIDDHLRGLDLYTFRNDLTFGTIANPPADWQPPADEIEVKSVKDAERVLQMLDASLFKSEGEIKKWAGMQLRHVHPDRLNGASDSVKSYAARQTRAVYAARDLLIARLGAHQ
ncbi:MAG: hypothetical protein ACYC4I_00310 [Minisyncoccota bacterium]